MPSCFYVGFSFDVAAAVLSSLFRRFRSLRVKSHTKLKFYTNFCHFGQANNMNRKVAAMCAVFMLFLASMTLVFGSFGQDVVSTFAESNDENIEIKTVYLTFDDGPSDRVTPKILDILDKENIKATFFIIGKQAETRQNIVKREHDSGHTVAVHSYTHEYKKIYSSADALIKDIDHCNDVIFDITGERSCIYRFPGGSFGLSSTLVKAVTEHGMRYIDWNASVRDAEIWQPTAYQLYHSAIATSADANNIVLLAHDSTTKTTTAEALPDIIKYYKDKGYTFARF